MIKLDLTYWIAMLMIGSAPFILHFGLGIEGNVTRICIITYMIIYGALMSWSTRRPF